MKTTILPYIICVKKYSTDTTTFPLGYVTYQSLSNNRYDSENWRRATAEEVEKYKLGNSPKIIQKPSTNKKIGSGLWQNY